MFTVSQEITVKCLEVSSDIFGYGRTSSIVFGNLRQSSEIVGSLRKFSEILRNCRKMAENSLIELKCLVLSRYTHSDPHIIVIRRFGSFYMMKSISHRRAIKTIMSTWRVPCRVLQSRNPDGCFWHPTPCATSNPESRPDFAFKSRIPSPK